MKKSVQYVIAIIVVAGIGLYIVLSNQSSTVTAIPVSPVTTTSNPGNSGNSGSENSPSSSNPAATPTSQWKDGTYTGSVADAVYGPIQVSAVISGGKLSAVNILQKPSDAGHTAEVSRTAIPQLVQEAITAQSANVNIVSGATQTSQGFEQTLGDALKQAQS